MRVYGNVEWILQALPGQTESKGTLAFLTDYDYDVMSGRVREVRLQPGRLDQMRQRYRYDHDGRILSVATSRDGHIWDRDAGYGYEAHGPLKRMELGRDSVQGIDRGYTINGWTKSLNVPSLLAADDPGGDGKSGANHEHVGRDAFGMVLGYYGKDFVHAGSVIDSVGAGSWQQLPQYGLYNGNIASWSWNTRKTDGTLLGALASTYRYDLLNRLRADTVRTRGVSSWDSPASKFRSAYTYDGNGNILTLDRKDDAGSHLDQLRYRYTPGMNRMTHVDELGGSTVIAGDIEDQDTLNYAYDATGNMTQDVSEGINTSGIVWTPGNKIRTITKAGSSPTSKLVYLYDGVGNRVVKRYYEPSNSLVKTTWYVRDAKGNVLGIYEKLAASGDVAAKENPVYGSSRIGEWRTGALYSSVATDTLVTNDVIYSRTIGNRRYELTDHLGNVRVAVSDVLLDHSGSPDAEVVSYTDYHPYGMAMTNRTWQADGYRFGYNGQEKTDEVAGSGNHLTAEFWEYDTRLGRRWNLDPRPVVGVSDYAALAGNPILFSDPRGDTILVRDQQRRSLMHLDDGKTTWQTKETADLFDKGVQWFEPNGKNYMKPIWTNPDIGKMDGIKHFSWDDIVRYADSHQDLLGYASNKMWNDWKSSKEGADGFFLSTVSGQLYWSDAVGQIPFAINAMRSGFGMATDNPISKTQAIKNVVGLGQTFGGGLFGSADKSRSYDNFMLLRGALFAAERYTVLRATQDLIIEHGIKSTVTHVSTGIKPADTKILGTPIDQTTAKKYGY